MAETGSLELTVFSLLPPEPVLFDTTSQAQADLWFFQSYPTKRLRCHYFAGAYAKNDLA
jgi:hypothetical protein